MAKATYFKKAFNLELNGSRGLESTRVEWRHGGGSSSDLIAWSPITTQKERGTLGMVGGFWNFKDHPCWHASFNKNTPLNSSQTLLPTEGGQVSRFVSLRSLFSAYISTTSSSIYFLKLKSNEAGGIHFNILSLLNIYVKIISIHKITNETFYTYFYIAF